MSSSDPTHFRLTDQELQASALRAQVMERRRRTLSHDINNVVQSVHSGLELLSKCINTPGVTRVSPQECIALLQQQFASLQRALNKLVSDVADAPRVPEVFDLSVLVQDALQALRHERAVQKARLQIDSGVAARARKVNIHTFTLALLLDAVDHLTPDGTLDVKVSRAHGHARVEIRSSSQHAYASSGERQPTIVQLVKHLVSAEEGELRLEQIGQTRVLTMQLSAPDMQEVDELKTSASRKGPLHVLIADRNRDAADSLAMIVQLEGHKAEAIYNGAQLTESLKSVAPDLVLLDIDLPGCDVGDLARAARELPSRPMVVQVSSSERKQYAGFDAHLVRPVEWPQVQRLIEQQKSRP